MGEEQRQRAAFQALEELLEPEPRSLHHVLAAARPLSGEEFEQVTAPPQALPCISDRSR